MAKRISVLVADDHPLFRGALADAVKARPELELVGAAVDGDEALERIRELEPRVAVLDIRMPGLDGTQILNAVIRDEISTRVLFCATETDGDLVYECLAGGAGGYIDKGSGAAEICDAIAAVARGRTVVSECLGSGVLEQIGLRGGGARGSREREKLRLSRRELEVLRLLADGLSTAEIAERLVVEPSTVKSHLQSTYDKLGVSGRGGAVAEGMRRGLIE